MASVSHHDDFEDEFDWESAVREIDTACLGATASTSNRGENPIRPIPRASPEGACPSKPERRTGSGRQSTLDRFVDSYGKHGSNGGGLRPGKSGAVGRGAHRSNGGGLCPGKVVSVGRGAHGNLGGGGGSSGGDQMVAVDIDLEAAKTWIYPVNIPLRDYQFSIAKTALFSNTLVALPTGLGKTLIAAVVMYNYFRWFPEGKIVFAAPSRPLVMQQIEACHNIVGIPQEWTIDMTGQMSPTERSGFWKSKRVFFVTPQVLEKDIQSGTCLVKQLVCLVIDEAHRAMGNYSYSVAVRELMAVPVQLRILALTATPGSKQETVQKVIDNLHISSLEYRNETDHDVSPYVHNRKLEVIQVAMGKDAHEINNLLLQAIQPFLARLCAIGVLYRRDPATLSPCVLLDSRDKFRQAPPLSLPQAKYGEIEGYFGVLITLYYILKLLSSHGIRPAYEMLEEKLRQGSFGRIMSRNETIWKAKLSMQQSLSHGASNPKLLKMIEVLIDHFKTKDPKDSRVIIFSNFRGSVRDIMDSLSSIGGINATEFIGQSSAKSLKGQTQKVQQAVLQKFRAGGYNVIVATSIGEEGLDIMEVDLVICFDANISPLRMVQRMGRTGRKHDGRVVVLACEGSELKGYSQKQATSKAVRKHMNNGGSKSFDFHSSPRMVPHICKPQVQFVELSIEQFVPRGRKVKDDSVHKSPLSNKLSNEEIDLIARYFCHSKEDAWRPSLIAFPHFQAFPSRVHTVRHSFKTTRMLIDAMQRLQGLSFSTVNQVHSVEVETSNQSMEVVTIIDEGKCERGLCDHNITDKSEYPPAELDSFVTDSVTVNHAILDVPKAPSHGKSLDSEASSFGPPSKSISGCYMPDLPSPKAPAHHFLFGAGFVTVDAVGGVFITSVPALPPTKEALDSKVFVTEDSTRSLSNAKKDACSFKASLIVQFDRLTMQPKAASKLTEPTELRCTGNKGILASQLSHHDPHQKQTLNGMEKFVCQTIVSKVKLSNSEDGVSETPVETEKVRPASLVSESTDSLKDMDLSPRLTHFIERGVVPESPILEVNHCSSKAEHLVCASFICEHDNVNCGLQSKCNSKNIYGSKLLGDEAYHSPNLLDTYGKNASITKVHVSPDISKLCGSPSSKGLATPSKNGLTKVQHAICEINSERDYVPSSPVNEGICSPSVNKSKNSYSEEWHLNSVEVSKSIQQAPKYKRLCRYGDIVKRLPSKSLEEKFCFPAANICGNVTRTKSSLVGHSTGMQKEKIHIKSFIEEEAEVSSDAEVSADEEEDKEYDVYEDSFIDDRINPTDGSTQAENSGGDVMAFYRRSLLTQSPMENLPYCLATSTDHEMLSLKTAETGSCSSEKINDSMQTPRNGLNSANQSTVQNSVTCHVDSERTSLMPEPGGINQCQREDESKMETRKRRLSFQHVGSVPVTDFLQEHLFLSDHRGKASVCSPPEDNDTDVFYDDEFYKGLDLDAVEAQAAELLRYKSELSVKKRHKSIPIPSNEVKEDLDVNFLASPSFDLGI